MLAFAMVLVAAAPGAARDELVYNRHDAHRHTHGVGCGACVERRLARGEFILRLEEMLASHDDVHRRLGAPDGRWSQPTDEGWPAVEAYMETFEADRAAGAVRHP